MPRKNGKIEDYSSEELAYQKGYAQQAKRRLQSDEAAGRVGSRDARRQREVFDRVVEGRKRGEKRKKPGMSYDDAATGLLEGLLKLGSLPKKGAENLREVREKSRR